MNIAMVSLGCAKNQVDAERMLALIEDAGHKIINSGDNPDIVIINTCGFIQSAKEEAIATILEFANLKSQGLIKKIVVTGCLAQRYKSEVGKLLPEADAVVGIGSNGDIVKILEKIQNEYIESFGENTAMPLSGKRFNMRSPFAYLKISDGCNHKCTYCAIPEIRGKYRSAPIEELIAEAEKLAENGATEIIVVAQDTTSYGIDLYKKPKLTELLKELVKIEKIHWIRVLYTYPERITDELLELIAKEKKIVKYLDIPIQHCNSEILKRMARTGNRESLTALIEKIRKIIPDITLRTSLITGFPGETEKQFEELTEFVKEMEFDRLGCFAYSQEENTPAAEFDNQIEDEIKIKRAEIIEDIQSRILDKKNENKIGKVFEVLVEGEDDETDGYYYGRTYADAPEVDCRILIDSEMPLLIGKYCNVTITEADGTELIGHIMAVNI